MPMPVRPLVAVLIASLVFVAAPLGAAPAARLPSWQDFYRIVHPALVRQEVIDPRRALVHLACLCEARSPGGFLFRVVEVRELVRGGASPRGVNQLLVLDRQLKVTDRIEIATAHGLYCDGASIILDRPAESPRLGQEGNLLRIDDGGRISSLGEIEAAGMEGIRPVLSSRPSLTRPRSAP